jgi:hypothetical protein
LIFIEAILIEIAIYSGIVIVYCCEIVLSVKRDSDIVDILKDLIEEL